MMNNNSSPARTEKGREGDPIRWTGRRGKGERAPRARPRARRARAKGKAEGKENARQGQG